MVAFDIDIEPTVFVLGAGASQPYGFPLSDGLKSIILNDSSHVLRECLLERRYDEVTIKQFKETLKYGDHGTIDLFLERKNSFRELGAYFIAHAIASKERHEALFPRPHNWYKILYDLLSLERDDESIPPLSIVSLNYDRSVEHFLSCCLEYNCPDRFLESGRCKLAKIRIVHAHGSIGSYDTVPYGDAGKDTVSLHAAAKSIRIISDSMESSADFQEAEKIIGSARNIVFIGFGYNKTTLERLLKTTQTDQVRLFGTGFQLQDEGRSELKQMFQEKMKLGNRNIDALEFLKELGFDKNNNSR